MTTSGSISTTVYETRALVDRAFARCRLRPQQITAEMLIQAQTNLYLVLSDMSNTGTPVWAYDAQYLPLVQGQHNLQLPSGTVDIRNAFYRSVAPTTPASGPTLAAGLITWSWAAAPTGGMLLINWSVLPTAVMSLQTSPDNVSWTTVQTLQIPAATGLSWYHVDGSANTYFRITSTTGSFTATAASLYSQLNDLLMGRLNQDDYELLPNKDFQGRPLQYWLNRQLQPVMRMWPTPDAQSAQNLVVVYRSRYIQDVGSLPQTIEVPQYWYEAITWKLAENLLYETPEADPKLIPVVAAKADQVMRLAWNQDRDKSPIRFNYNIHAYTA